MPYELKALLEEQYSKARQGGVKGVVVIPNTDLKVRGEGPGREVSRGWPNPIPTSR